MTRIAACCLAPRSAVSATIRALRARPGRHGRTPPPRRARHPCVPQPGQRQRTPPPRPPGRRQAWARVRSPRQVRAGHRHFPPNGSRLQRTFLSSCPRIHPPHPRSWLAAMSCVPRRCLAAPADCRGQERGQAETRPAHSAGAARPLPFRCYRCNGQRDSGNGVTGSRGVGGFCVLNASRPLQ